MSINIAELVARAQEICGNCGVRRDDLFICPCRSVHYCSTHCQLRHWKSHKEKCSNVVRGQPKLRTCYYCGKPSFHIFMCQCGQAQYCDVVCQRKHWTQHRTLCSIDTTASQDQKRSVRRMDNGTQTDATMAERRAEVMAPQVEPQMVSPSAAMHNRRLQGSMVNVGFNAFDQSLNDATRRSTAPFEQSRLGSLEKTSGTSEGRGLQTHRWDGSHQGAASVHRNSAVNFLAGEEGEAFGEEDQVRPEDSILTEFAEGHRVDGTPSMMALDPSMIARPRLLSTTGPTSQTLTPTSNPLIRQGTVLSNVRLRHGGVHLPATPMSALTPQEHYARQLQHSRVELFLKEEMQRSDIVQERKDQMYMLVCVLRKAWFVDSIKKWSQREEAGRLDIIAQSNLWLTTQRRAFQTSAPGKKEH